jgi:hypothetical protein
MFIRFIGTLLAGALLLTAQPGASVFQKAPPAVDEALRKQVTAFYQTHVEGKTRLAQGMVAEESADVFFNAQKPKLQSFEIQQVSYAKDFQQATVMVLAERDVMIPFAGSQTLKVPMESYWKLVQGKWLWFVPEQACAATPFGCAPTTAAPAGPKMTAEQIADKIKKASQQNFEGQFGFNKTQIALGGAVREVEITFKNDMDGWVILKMLQEFSDPDFELVGGETQIKPQSSAKVVVRLKKDAKITQLRSVNVPLYVQPFHRSAGLVVHLKPGA